MPDEIPFNSGNDQSSFANIGKDDREYIERALKTLKDKYTVFEKDVQGASGNFNTVGYPHKVYWKKLQEISQGPNYWYASAPLKNTSQKTSDAGARRVIFEIRKGKDGTGGWVNRIFYTPSHYGEKQVKKELKDFYEIKGCPQWVAERSLGTYTGTVSVLI